MSCLIIRLFSLFVGIFFSLTIFADQLIIEPDMGRKPILDLINQTNYSLNLVMYGLTDDALLTALIKQKNQGKTVKIILEDQPYKATNENTKAITALNQQTVNLQSNIPPFSLIHQKTLIIDEKRALVMTFNFTNSTFKNQRNFGILIDDPERVNEIKNTFSSDWNHHPTDTIQHIILSPDNSREKLLINIQQANLAIDIYAQSISDKKIANALVKAAKRGVNIRILTSIKLRDKINVEMENAGITVQQSKHYYIHAKAFVFDHRLAIIGSINLTQASLDKNRELSIASTDATVIKQLEQTFQTDWQASSSTIIQTPKNNIDLKKIAKLSYQFAKIIHKALEQ